MDADKCFSYPRKSASSAVKILLGCGYVALDIQCIPWLKIFSG